MTSLRPSFDMRQRNPIGIRDHLAGAALAISLIVILIKTSPGLGYARDEGFYVQAAESYARWFQALAHDWRAATTPQALNGTWIHATSEHPALVKSMFALSWLLFYKTWHLFDYEGTSFRFGGMIFSGGCVWLLYIWGTRAASRVAGVSAALLFALIPRIFFHSHLACMDVPIAACWAWCLYSYWRSLEPNRWGWVIWTGVTFGLALDTKHNAWFLPFAVIAHQLVTRGPLVWRALKGSDVANGGGPSDASAPTPKTGRARLLLLLKAIRPHPSLLAMAAIGPLVFIALWPWLWPDPIQRFIQYVEFHLHHDYYSIEFLGETYWKPPMPRGYTWIMTLATVPTITIILFVLALSRFLKAVRREPVSSLMNRVEVLWILAIVISYSPWLSTNTPIYGGTKHWFTAYPFICLFAGISICWLVDRARELAMQRGASKWVRWGAGAAVFLALIAAPFAETAHSHPWGLTNYTPLVGGAQGGASLGLNRGFWGFTTGAVVPFLNQRVPPNQTVFIHDTAIPSWGLLQRDGQLRQDIHWTLNPVEGLYGLYHHEAHMTTIEYQLWMGHGTSTPVDVEAYDGVPVIWVYGPSDTNAANARALP